MSGGGPGDLDACAGLLERGDPDRFRALLAAPPAARPVLLPIWTFNLEVARAPWVTAEPMIAEMRLQFWRDTLDEIAAGGPVRRHEVATPLAGVIDAEGARVLARLVEARRHDCTREPFATDDDLAAYIRDTAGGLMWVSARALGAEDPDPVHAAGQAAGVAAWLLAAPELAARGHRPLPGGTEQAGRLAQAGLADLARARAGRRRIPARARPALLQGWRAPALLRRAAADPDRVLAARLPESEARKRAALITATLRGMI